MPIHWIHPKASMCIKPLACFSFSDFSTVVYFNWTKILNNTNSVVYYRGKLIPSQLMLKTASEYRPSFNAKANPTELQFCISELTMIWGFCGMCGANGMLSFRYNRFLKWQLHFFTDPPNSLPGSIFHKQINPHLKFHFPFSQAVIT